jgi:hypothetical protein
MRRDLRYISRDVSVDVEGRMDYRFLANATKKAKGDIGY